MSARSYDLDVMEEFISLLDQKIAALTEHNADVRRTAEAVLSQFSGESATAYAASHSTWQDEASVLLAQVRDVRDTISTARQNYLTAEQANREMRS